MELDVSKEWPGQLAGCIDTCKYMYTVRVTVCQSTISSELASCCSYSDSYSAGEGKWLWQKPRKQRDNFQGRANSQLASRAFCGQRADVLIPSQVVSSLSPSRHLAMFVQQMQQAGSCRIHSAQRQVGSRRLAAQHSRELWCYICGPSPPERERESLIKISYDPICRGRELE